MSYCTSQEALDRTGKTLTQAQLDAAQLLIETWTGYAWQEKTAAQEEYIGSNKTILFLKHAPVRALTAVLIDDEEVTVDNFEVNKNKNAIYYSSGWATDESENIKLTYTYGYDAPTEDIKMACAEIAIMRLVNPFGALSIGVGKAQVGFGATSGGLMGILRKLPKRRFI